MPHEAKDLVERLLKLNPGERIGAGKPGSPNDYNMILSHPYFEGIDFSNLLFSTVPLKLPNAIKPDFELIDNLIP